MLRILIADDEYHVRKRLSERIEWNKLGVDDPVVCDDGDVALEVLEKERDRPFSILLTDIRMPRMDGLTLAREVRKKFPELVILIMSAYDDKEYLKSALDLQVAGYIEKPIELDRVTECVERAIEKTAVSRDDRQRDIRRMKQQRLKELGYMLCRALPEERKDGIRRELEQLCPGFCRAERFAAILINFSSQDALSSDYSIFEMIYVMCEKLEKEGLRILLTQNHEEIPVLFCGLCEEEEIKKQALKMLDVLSDLSVKSHIRISIGGVYEDIGDIYKSYQDAVITRERHFYHDCLVLESIASRTAPYEFHEDDFNLFRQALQMKKADACLRYLKLLSEELEHHDYTLVRSTRNYYFRLAVLMQSFRVVQRAETSSDYYLWELIYCADSLKQLGDYLCKILRECFPSEHEKRPEENIEIIKGYIHKHAGEPGLSLTEISRASYMSVTYLCMFFKEQTGMTIKAYLIDYRMKQAASLLINTNMKVSEISEMTGFSDQNYFTKRFSRHFGVTPTKYKEREESKCRKV